MLPVERRSRIKALIQSKQNMKISELSELLGVSEMTIHRDLRPLLEEGLIHKTFGGITLASDVAETKQQTDSCIICSRGVKEQLAYRIILPDNQIETACCAHCGLIRHRQLGSEMNQALCHDFFTHTTIGAPYAWYVMDTSLQIGCCQPQVLTFANKEHAEKFVLGFGGDVYDFETALEVMHNKMNGQEGCH